MYLFFTTPYCVDKQFNALFFPISNNEGFYDHTNLNSFSFSLSVAAYRYAFLRLQRFCLHNHPATYLITHFQEFTYISNLVLPRVLRQTRQLILNSNQKRVCARLVLWNLHEVWTYGSYLFTRFRKKIVSRFTYRHLTQSDLFSAGLLLNQPNFYLFLYALANPYFWVTMQQTLNSHYRYC